MSLTNDQMRAELTKVYSGQKWADKVRKMTDNQVLAIYLRLKAQNKI